MKKIFFVKKNGSGWQGNFNGNEKILINGKDKTDVVRRTIAMAEKKSPAEVIIESM